MRLDRSTLAREARAIRRELAGTASQRDIDASLPVEAIRCIRESGLGALRVPAEYGGAELSFEALADVVLQIAAGDASTAQSLQPHFIFLERVRLMGSESQRRRYLGAAADGVFFGNAISEVGAGVGEWRTRLARHGDGWRLDGSKFYATGTALAESTFVGALDPEGKRFLAIVPVTRQGITLGDDWRTMGQRATASGTVRFDDVAVADDELIPLAPWEQRRHHTGAGSQIIHCAIDAGIAAAALDDAVLHAQTKARPSRDSGHARVVDDPVVHHVVGEIAAAAFAAEASVLLAARALDLASEALYATDLVDGLNTPEVDALLIAASIAVATAKIVSTRAALLASEKLFEVGGASAAASALNLDRHWRNARTHTLHDPLAHKFRVIGDHLLSGKAPPNTFTY